MLIASPFLLGARPARRRGPGRARDRPGRAGRSAASHGRGRGAPARLRAPRRRGRRPAAAGAGRRRARPRGRLPTRAPRARRRSAARGRRAERPGSRSRSAARSGRPRWRRAARPAAPAAPGWRPATLPARRARPAAGGRRPARSSGRTACPASCDAGARKGKANRLWRSCTNGMSTPRGLRDTSAMAEDRGRVLAFPRAPDAIELRHLRSFVAVAEDLNFGRAAEQLYLSQPALSRQIRALEQLVGCELLRRSTHRVELTLAGEALLDRARRLLQDLDEAVSVTQSVGDEIAARLARFWKPLVEASNMEASLAEIRSRYEALHAQFAPPPEAQVPPV